MKELSDGTKVSSRSYYYLLDWNEENKWCFMINEFNKNRLCDLNIIEYNSLFNFATDTDKILLNIK